MSELDRNGGSLYFATRGHGLPVLLTHGFAATSRMWSGQIEAFQGRRQLITWDIRGHGRSRSPREQAGYSVDETLTDMAALLDHHGHERAIIGGHSLGGYLAYRLGVPMILSIVLTMITVPLVGLVEISPTR